MGIMGSLGLTRRQRILGLPIGPQQVAWNRVAGVGAAAAGTGAAGTQVVRRARQQRSSEGSESLVDKGREALESSKELVDSGKEAASTISRFGSKASEASEAADQAKTPWGRLSAAAKTMSGSDGGSDGGSNGEQTHKQRLIVQEQIDIALPRRDVYDQWTQFEEFPTFFRAVEQVDQEEDETLTWQAKMLASRREWQAEILEQIPEKRIVWQSKGDVKHRGVVTFHELDDDLTRVQVEMEYQPSGFVEKFGNLFLTVRHRVRKDLRLFKHHLEFENEKTGAWRGEIRDGEAQSSDDQQQSDEGDEAQGAAEQSQAGDQAENEAEQQGPERLNEEERAR